MAELNRWFGGLAGALAVVAGVYALRRPSSVARWLENKGVPDLGATGRLRRIQVLGFLFIVAGAFFVIVTVRNY